MHLPGDVEENPLNTYRIGPLLYMTEMLLPELPNAEAQPYEQPVTIRLGDVPASLAAPITVSAFCEASPSEFLLRLPDIADYYVRDGAEVTIAPVPGAPELDIRSYLIGNVFAVLCHQRGLLPLHASAIATPEGAVAFVGNSGAGKSTLVAFLARRGHRVLADDICLIDPAAPRETRVLPVAPWLKLWSTTLDALGHSKAGLARIFAEDDKYRYILRQDDAPTSLAEIVLLERADAIDGATARFERLTPAHALRAVFDMTYHSWLVHAMGQTETYFLRCGQALEGVRGTRMRRAWGFDAMESTLAALEAHLAART